LVDSGQPIIDSIVAMYNVTEDDASNLGLLMFAPCFGAVLTSSMVASRYIYSLSRSGFLPPVLSLTSKTTGAPYIASIAVFVFSVLVTAFGQNVQTGTGETVISSLQNAECVFALLGYISTMIFYIIIKVK